MCPPASETECGDLNLTGVAKAIKYHRRLQHFYAGREDGGRGGGRQAAYLALTMAQRLLQGGIPATVYPGESPLLLAFPGKRYIGVGIEVTDSGKVGGSRVWRVLAGQVAAGALDGAMVADPGFFPVTARDGLPVIHPDLFGRLPRLALEAARLLSPDEAYVLAEFGQAGGRWRKAEARGYALRLAKHLLSLLASGGLQQYKGLNAAEVALAGILAEAGPAGVTGRTLGRIWRLANGHQAPTEEQGGMQPADGRRAPHVPGLQEAIARLRSAGFRLIMAENSQKKAICQEKAVYREEAVYRLE